MSPRPADQLLPVLIHNMQPSFPPAVCNNAVWAVGEISVKISGGFGPYLESILPGLVAILDRSPAPPRMLLENTGLALGRLCLSCPEILAPHVAHFGPKLCVAISTVKDSCEEKDQAFLGLCHVIVANPQGFVPVRAIGKKREQEKRKGRRRKKEKSR
jgi:transportin-1